MSISTVSLLLHFEGSNGSTTFTDSSSNANTLTAFGNASLSTARSRLGTASGSFDGNGDYLTCPTTPGGLFDFGSGDFTIKASIYTTTVSGIQQVAGVWPGDYTASWRFLVVGDSIQFIGWVGYSVTISSSSCITTNTWLDIAAKKVGSTLKLYCNGTQVGSGSISSVNGNASGAVLDIGRQQDGVGGSTWFFNGNIDELIISKDTPGVSTFTHISRNLIVGSSPLLLAGDGLESKNLIIQKTNLQGRANVKSYKLNSRELLLSRVPQIGRFSVRSFNHTSLNLVIQRSVLLGKLTGVKIFPEAVPSQIQFKPAKFVTTEHKSQSGEVEIHLWADSNTGATLQLSYANISDTTANTIMVLWDSVYGTYSYVKIPSSVLAGIKQELTTYILSGGKSAKWFFTEPPKWEGRIKGYGDLTVNLRSEISNF